MCEAEKPEKTAWHKAIMEAKPAKHGNSDHRHDVTSLNYCAFKFFLSRATAPTW